MNLPVADFIGVAELDRRLKHAVEAASVTHWVQGEIGALRRVASGHCYFTLKDEAEDAIIECVVYRFQAVRVARHLVDGALIQLYGKATVWAPRGRLQFVAESARPAGRGAILEALERLKAKLHAEGLFAPGRKRPLPARPHIVGVVTSGHGAAWHDIQTVALRRSPLKLVLCPALVQGDGAVDSLLRALNLVEKYPGLDALIIGRGGGSLEDLMAFNDERLVRRIAECRVPVVSAVGHEIDTTLCDLVADARAATPSEAAELLVPDHSNWERQLLQLSNRLRRAIKERLREDRGTLLGIRAKLSDPRFVIAEKQQWLDELTIRLERRKRRTLASSRQRINMLTQRLSLRHPRAVLMRSRLLFKPVEARLLHAIKRRLIRDRQRLEREVVRLDGLSPLAVLARGYAIALTQSGVALRDSSQVAVGDSLSLRISRGVIAVRVEGSEEL